MPYHTNEALLAQMQSLADRGGPRVRLHELGKTVQGRAMMALAVSSQEAGTPGVPRPQALVVANIHGNEVVASEAALEVLRLLVDCADCEPARQALAKCDVTVVPAVNLDARAQASVALCQGQIAHSARANANGVDLNRNFPIPAGARDVWYPLAGSRFRFMPWYRGRHAFSEPETRALRDLVEGTRPQVIINLHSVGELFLYPSAYSHHPPPDLPRFEAMAAAFTAAQDGQPYTVKQSRAWYAILGDHDDWAYEHHGILSVTVEVSRPLAGVEGHPLRALCPLWWMNPSDPDADVQRVARPCLHALAAGMAC